MTTDITVCIPVYKAEAFVRDAIESVLAQTYEQFRLLISVDPAGDRSGEICREYETDRRVTVMENETRLGWVGNVNACLDQVQTPFFAFCFHDDLLEPIHLERLRAALMEAPDAVAAFGAIQRFGNLDKIDRPVDEIGTPASRAAACINGNFPAYSLKNLMRSEPVFDGLRLPSTGDEGYVADLPFALGYSLAGNFVAVPDVVYRKSHRNDSVTSGWREFDVYRLAKNETNLKLQMLRVVQKAGLELKDRQDLVQLILHPRGTQKPSSSDDLLNLVDFFDIMSPTLLIAELLGQGPDSDCEFPDAEDQKIRHARNRFQLARNFRRVGDLKAARHYADQALRLDGNSPDVHALHARLALANARGTDRLSEINQAHIHAQKATELTSEDPSAWMLLARVHERLSDWTAVKNCVEKAMSLGVRKPERAEKLLARADINLRSNPIVRWQRRLRIRQS